MKQLAETHRTLIGSLIALAIIIAAAYFYTVGEAPGRNTIGTLPPEPKVQIEEICRASLTYTTFPEGTDTERYVQECIDGKHPNVIEDFVKRMNAENAAE